MSWDSNYQIEKKIKEECDAWACWNDLSETEKEETESGYWEVAEISHKAGIEAAIKKLRYFSPSMGRSTEMSGVDFANWLEQELLKP